jgi:hypothetical protein
MKTFTKFFALILTVGTLTFACQPETVKPKSDKAGQDFSATIDTHPTPNPQCSMNTTFDVVNGGGSSVAPSTQGGQDYGTIVVANDPTSVWVVLQFGAGWYAKAEKIWVGPAGQAPVNQVTNTFNFESFSWSKVVTPSRNFDQVVLPFNMSGPACVDLVIYAEIHRVNQFSQPINITTVWGSGTPYLNGYVCSGFCFTGCPEFATTPTCNYTATAGASFTLGSTVTNGGLPPFTWTWNDGTTGSTRTVTPSTTTSYTLTYRDAAGVTESWTYQVCVGATAGCECAPPPMDPPGINASCTRILTGLPAGVNGGSTCAIITATAAPSAVQPVTYTWSNGATGATIQACAAGTYTVTVVDGNGSSASASVEISATNIKCGNSNGNNGFHKVNVCHKPPGNPANVQQICIDWSGVPAHVAAFRDPAMNYQQGHDSGCHIGPCGIVACGGGN